MRNLTKIKLFKVYLKKITVLVKAVIKMIDNKLVNAWLALLPTIIPTSLFQIITIFNCYAIYVTRFHQFSEMSQQP